jgi:hypothetical protein
MTSAADQPRAGNKTFENKLRRAVVRAVLAPSVHNTQPWRFVIDGDTLEVHADRSRQLDVLDPVGRQLLLSVGCALFNLRVSLAAAGEAVEIRRFPDPLRSDLIATVRRDPTGAVQSDIAPLVDAIERRRTNRRRFADDPVPADVVAFLADAARAEGAVLSPVRDLDDRLTLARLSQHADQLENDDPAYRAELRAWTTDDPHRGDGVPFDVVPRVDGTARDDIPMRDFDSSGNGALPPNTRSSLNQCLLLLGTRGDSPEQWLIAGEALERVLLVVAARGLAACPLTQVIEIAVTRDRLRHELRLGMFPHVLLRVGYAPPTPATRRRRLVDVLVDAGLHSASRG